MNLRDSDHITEVVRSDGSTSLIDTDMDLDQARERVPLFFNNSDGSVKTHGQNETLDVHRGCVIVSSDLEHSNRTLEHKVRFYAFCCEAGTDNWSAVLVNCDPQPRSVEEAEGFINHLVDRAKPLKYGVNLQ